MEVVLPNELPPFLVRIPVFLTVHRKGCQPITVFRTSRIKVKGGGQFILFSGILFYISYEAKSGNVKVNKV